MQLVLGFIHRALGFRQQATGNACFRHRSTASHFIKQTTLSHKSHKAPAKAKCKTNITAVEDQSFQEPTPPQGQRLSLSNMYMTCWSTYGLPCTSGKSSPNRRPKLVQHGACVTWKDMPMGGLAHAFFSRVVAISSTEATKALSVCPVNRLIFHTRACFLASYLALPAAQMQGRLTWELELELAITFVHGNGSGH